MDFPPKTVLRNKHHPGTVIRVLSEDIYIGKHQYYLYPYGYKTLGHLSPEHWEKVSFFRFWYQWFQWRLWFDWRNLAALYKKVSYASLQKVSRVRRLLRL